MAGHSKKSVISRAVMQRIGIFRIYPMSSQTVYFVAVSDAEGCGFSHGESSEDANLLISPDSSRPAVVSK